MITHTHTRSHIHTSPSCSLVNGCCRQKTDLASVERVSQVGFEVPYKVINTAQHTAEVIQHTPHHESRRKPHFGEQCNSRGSNDHTCGAQGGSRDVRHPETGPTQTERERERERERDERMKERKETKTVCRGLRRRDVKVPCHTSRCVQRSHIHTHDHTYTHTITHTHVSLVFSSEWVLSSLQEEDGPGVC